MSCVPCCSTLSSSTINRERGIGGSGSPILPHAVRKMGRQRDNQTESERARERESGRRREGETKRRHFSPTLPLSRSPTFPPFLQNVSAEVFILDNVSEHLLNIEGVNHLMFLFEIRAFERDFVEHFLQDRVQA